MSVICNNAEKCTCNWCYHIKFHDCDGSCRIRCHTSNVDVCCEDPIKVEKLKIRKEKLEKLNNNVYLCTLK